MKEQWRTNGLGPTACIQHHGSPFSEFSEGRSVTFADRKARRTYIITRIGNTFLGPSVNLSRHTDWKWKQDTLSKQDTDEESVSDS